MSSKPLSDRSPMSRGSHVSAKSVSCSTITNNKLTFITKDNITEYLPVTVSHDGTPVTTAQTINCGGRLGASNAGDGVTDIGFSVTSLSSILADDNNANTLDIRNVERLNFTGSVNIGTTSTAATTTGTASIAIGENARTLTYSNSVAIGFNTTTVGNDGVSIGNGSSTLSTQGICIGNDSASACDYGISVGRSANNLYTGAPTKASAPINFGSDSNAFLYSISIGRGANATTNSSHVLNIGESTIVSGNANVNIGRRSQCLGGDGNIAILGGTGVGGNVNVSNSIVISATNGGGGAGGNAKNNIGGDNSVLISIFASRLAQSTNSGNGVVAIGTNTVGNYAGVITSADTIVAIGTRVSSDAESSVLLGPYTSSSYANSVVVGNSIASRVINESALSAVRYERVRYTDQTTTLTLLDIPLLDDETIALDVFVLERVTGGVTDLNQTRAYIFRDYHASQSASTVTVNSGSTTTSVDVGMVSADATVTITANSTNVRVAVTSVANADTRQWDIVARVCGIH